MAVGIRFCQVSATASAVIEAAAEAEVLQPVGLLRAAAELPRRLAAGTPSTPASRLELLEVRLSATGWGRAW